MNFGNRAFTLIELIIALAIASVLVALAVPQINQYRARSSDTVAMNDARNSAMLLSTNMIR